MNLFVIALKYLFKDFIRAIKSESGKTQWYTWPFDLGIGDEEEAPAKVLPKWNAEKNRWEDTSGNEVLGNIETEGGFKEDAYYRKSQNILYPFGTNILEGKLPDFYSSLGKTGGTEFENMLALINRDTAKAVNENLVRRNISRGGVGLSTIAKATADTGIKLRWTDFLRAQGEKQWLMGTGLETIGGVRSAALNQQGQTNQWTLSQKELDMKQAAIDAEEETNKNSLWQGILSSAIGAIGGIYGAGQISKAISGLNSSTILGSAAGKSSASLLYNI